MAQPSGPVDPILRAMRDELARSRDMKFANLEKPYYISYTLDEGDDFSASATLGGLLNSNRTRFRIPRIQVRVGDYKFDNTNYVGTGYFFGSRYAIDSFPLDNLYPVLRRYFWLGTDQQYKAAVETIARKRAALKNIAETEPLTDFAPAEPVRLVLDVPAAGVDQKQWTHRVRELSSIFASYPQIRASGVEFRASNEMHYMLTSEGTELRIPEQVTILRARAYGQAPDGMSVRDSITFQSLGFDRMPGEAELQRAMTSLADAATALARAPAGEEYNGPVLFEGLAGAQIFAEVLGRNLIFTRKPVTEPGRPGVFPTSELEGRRGARILPEWMDVVDDPTQSAFHGQPLFGYYSVDFEGVKAKPLTMVEKGVLKNFFLTRQPVRGFTGSTGHARLPGAFGANSAGLSNLFVRAAESVSMAELRKKMMEICRTRNKPYGIVVRKMDFPSSASMDEARRLLTGSAQSGGSARPVSLPLRVFRVYPDGREELVRGLRFRGLNARSLKDILAAGDDTNILEYMENGAPFALIGTGSFAAESSVIAPSILIDDLELMKLEDEQPKLPIVPPPVLTK